MNTRRSFLARAAAVWGAAVACGSPHRVAGRGLECGVPASPETQRFRDLWNGLPRSSGLKVTRVETFVHNRNLCFVRVTADDGSQGVGQIATFEADLSAQILHRMVAPHALGLDPYDIDGFVDRAVEANYKFPWSFACRAVGGIDTALWDLRGKRENKSVVELLGSNPRPLPAYGSSMSRTITPEEEAARLVRLRDEAGFRSFKIRIGKVCGHDVDQWPGRTEAIIPTVRKAVGAEISLHADANSCYTPARAIEVGRILEEHGYDHYEEPCPYWELEWTAEVAAALERIPVAGGEQDNDLAQWRRMIAMGAVDIAQPDVLYVGGPTRLVRVALEAADAGLPCVPHSANLSMVTLFTMHLFGALPNAGPFFEISIENDGFAGAYDPLLTVEDGKVAIPDGPGWGVRVNPDWLERAQRQVTAPS